MKTPVKVITPTIKNVTVKKLVKVVTWDCGVELHSHKTRKHCATCIGKQPASHHSDNRKRDSEIFLFWSRGEKTKDVATKFELSTARVTQIVNYHIRNTAYRARKDTSGEMDFYYESTSRNMKEQFKHREKWVKLHNKYFPELK
jgi:Mor family transcriptional regulator